MDSGIPLFPYIVTDADADDIKSWSSSKSSAIANAGDRADEDDDGPHYRVYRLIAIVKPKPKPVLPERVVMYTEDECENGKEA